MQEDKQLLTQPTNKPMNAQLQQPTLAGFIALLFFFSAHQTFSQVTYADTLNCEGGTPTFTVDLAADPDSLWVSDPAERAGMCCGADNNCVQFSLTLAPDATGINFYIPDGCGAAPTGSLFYQVDCGPLTDVGTPICLDGEGPFIITFCKPGANENCYSIQSIGPPKESEDVTITDACLDSLWITGLDEPTIGWTSVFPGAIGEYDFLLDCTEGCDTVIVEGEPGEEYPELIKYEVCGTSIGGCAGDPHCDTIDVNIVPTLEVGIFPEAPTICYGEAGIELVATGLGGAEPYTYTWNTGDTGNTLFATEPGTYFVEIDDITGCAVAFDTVVVTEYLEPITADAGPDLVVCAVPDPTADLGAFITGSETAVWTGGTGVFGPDTTALEATYTPDAAELDAGFATLILTTTDNGSCPGDTDTITILYPTFTTEIAEVLTDIDCFENATGEIDLTPTGGALPLTYAWDTGETTEDLTGLTAGAYGITLTDTNGCEAIFAYELIEPEPLALTALTENISCFELNDGTIDISPTGGTFPYDFTWATGEETEDLTDLLAGTYDLTLTDENGCMIDTSFTLTEPLDLILDETPSMVSCNGFTDGAIDITPSGGVPDYTYAWDTGELTEDLTGVEAGTYTVTITDANGCTEVLTVDILEPTVLESEVLTEDVACNGDATGAIDLAVTGGTPVYTYAWATGEATEDLTDIPTGTYSFTVTDANGCLISDTLFIDEPEALDLVLDGIDILCYGDSTGSIDANITGGVPGYSWEWTSGEMTEDITVLTAGTYGVTVTDENGCDVTASIALTQPDLLETSISGTDVSCPDAFDGAADLEVTGGIPPYTFEWDTGDVPEDTEDLTDLGEGTYYVTVTDDNGCPAMDSVAIAEPIDFDAGPDSTFAVCANDASVNLNDFLLATTAGEWSETTGSGQFNPLTGLFDPTDLPAGDYIFNYTIPTFTPCTDTLAVFTVTVHPIPDANISSDDVMGCAPLAITFTNMGDYTGGTCVWYMGDGTMIEGCEGVTHSYEYAGPYDVELEVTSEFGCVNTVEAENYIHVFEKPEAAFTYSPDYPNIQDPEVKFTNESEGAIDYIWDFGDGSEESTSENPYHLFPDVSNAEYTVELIAISDQGCTDTAYQIIMIEDVLIFYVPNVFTPDGDMFNEEFKPVMTSGYDVETYHLTIFNRWGEVVFESMNADFGWDGTYGGGDLVQDGVYIWTIEFKETLSTKRHQLNGHVTVLK